MNIWKDPKVELPDGYRNVVFISYNELYVGKFDRMYNYFNVLKDYEHHYNEVDKWCYEEDLIKQAENNAE